MAASETFTDTFSSNEMSEVSGRKWDKLVINTVTNTGSHQFDCTLELSPLVRLVDDLMLLSDNKSTPNAVYI